MHFFLSRPFVITLEDLLRWCWRNYTGKSKDDPLKLFERRVGYLWVFLWFSYCLSPFVRGLRDAGVIADAVVNMWPFGLGAGLGLALLKTLGREAWVQLKHPI
jgi:hypothetical protein